MRTIQTVPTPFSSKFDCDGRPMADNANRVNFLNQENGLSRDFCQFGVDSVPQNYYHRPSTQENSYGHLNQATLDSQGPNFLSQAAAEPSYQHQQSQMATDSSVLRQQASAFSTAPPVYRQSHLSADAPPFCHQTQQSDPPTFQPPVGTPSYIQNQPPIETVLYQHQNQLAVEPPIYQRAAQGQVYQTTNQTGPEATMFHQNQANIETPLYHQTSQRTGDSSTFRDQHHPVQEGQIFHQTLSAVEAALYRNHHPTEASLYHQQNQASSDLSLYHSNQQGSDSTVYHRQETTLYHHPTTPPHFVHQNQASGPQAPTFYHQNQATPETTSFYRFQNQTGDSNFQRPGQPNTAFYHLQNQTEAQYHQQNSSESSFHLLPNQRTVEPQLHSSTHIDGPFYPQRSLDVDPQLCQQNHSAAEAQLFQFQNQANQENQLHHQNRSITEIPGFSYQGEVAQDARVHQPNHGPVEIPIANFQNQSTQESLRHQSHPEVPVYHYQSQVSQDVQLRQQNPNASELPLFHYQNQATQGAQFHHSTMVVPKSSALYHQKPTVGETKIPQNLVLSLTKSSSQNWEATERKSHKVVVTEPNMSFVNLSSGQFPGLPVSDTCTVLSVHFSSKTSTMTLGDDQQNIGATERGNVNQQTASTSEPNLSVQSFRGASRNGDKVRGNRHVAALEKEADVVSDSERDIDEAHLDHNRNTLKTKLSPLSTVDGDIDGNEKKETSRDDSAVFVQNRSGYPNGFHTLSSESVKLGEESSQVAQERIAPEQNLNKFDRQSFDADKSLNLNPCPGSITDEDESSQKETHLSFNSQLDVGNSSSSSNNCDWTTQAQSIAEVSAEVGHRQRFNEDEASQLLNTEENFTVSNAHFLPRPPDILLTLPAGVESEREFDVLARHSPNLLVQPGLLSQDGSDELSLALEFLFDRPEDIELPLTPPPTPPVSPPLVTPPCSPPLSSAPSSPRSSTPPFSSPLSSSPHVGDVEMQGGQPAHWEPYKMQTQPQFSIQALEKPSVSGKKEIQIQVKGGSSSIQLDEICFPNVKTTEELHLLLPDEVPSSSVQGIPQQESIARVIEGHYSTPLTEATCSSIGSEGEKILPLEDLPDLTTQQLSNPALGATTSSHQLDHNSILPQSGLEEELSTECPLTQNNIQPLGCEDCNDQMSNSDFCLANSSSISICLPLNTLEADSSPYFVPIQDEVTQPLTEAAAADVPALNSEGTVSPELGQKKQGSSPSPSSMVVNGFHSPIVHRLKL